MRDGDPELVRQLSAKSSPYRDPLAQVDWQKIDTETCWLPEAALSLHGLTEFEVLSPAVRRRLSQYEFINIVYSGLWLESVFLQRLARKLEPTMPGPEYEYLLHELREETGHSLMFLQLLRTSGLPVPSGAWRLPWLTSALGRWLPADSEVFRLAIVIGEHVPDRFNRWLREQGDAVAHVVREVCTLHVVDEARHIAFACGNLEQLVRKKGAIGKALLGAAGGLLLAQLAQMIYFPPAPFYELAGLTPGVRWRRLALANPVRRRFVAARLAPTLQLLRSYGLRMGDEALPESAA